MVSELSKLMLGAKESCQAVSEKVKPLLSGTPITSFNVSRIFCDGYASGLSNDFLWTKDLYNSLDRIGMPDYHELKEGRTLWLQELKNPIQHVEFYETARRHINTNTAMTLVHKNEQYADLYILANHKADSDLLNYFVNHGNALDKVLEQFNQSASVLRKMADEEKFQIPPVVKPYCADGSQRSQCERINCILSIHLKRRIKLTSREFQVVSMTIQGLSAKEVANEFKISYRTVENTLQMVRAKLNCSQICKLIMVFFKAGVLDQIIKLCSAQY